MFQGGTIKGALNLPAQSLYDSLETLYTLCQAAGIKRVIWWCGKQYQTLSIRAVGSGWLCLSFRIGLIRSIANAGSSRGRGTRAAGWFDDLIADKGDEKRMQSLILEGGIKAWATAGAEYQEFMVGFERGVWEK